MDIYDIVKGGDERIKLKENGLNKYHILTHSFMNLFLTEGLVQCQILMWIVKKR